MSKHALNKRLDQHLTMEEVQSVKTAFIQLLVEKGVSPDGFTVDQVAVYDVIQLVAKENPLWRGIRAINGNYQSKAFQNIRQTCANMCRKKDLPKTLRLMGDYQETLEETELEQEPTRQPSQETKAPPAKAPKSEKAGTTPPEEGTADKLSQKSAQKQHIAQHIAQPSTQGTLAVQQAVVTREQQRLVADIIDLHNVHENIKLRKRELKALEKRRVELMKQFPAFNEDPFASE